MKVLHVGEKVTHTTQDVTLELDDGLVLPLTIRTKKDEESGEVFVRASGKINPHWNPRKAKVKVHASTDSQNSDQEPPYRDEDIGTAPAPMN